MRKILFLLIVSGITVPLGWQVYRKYSAPANTQKRSGFAVAVKVEPVRKRAISNVRIFTGTLLPESYFVVAPKVSGRLEKLHVNIGDAVKHRSLVAIIESNEYHQQVEQARAEEEVARAVVEENLSNLGVAEKDFHRIRTLVQKNIASQADLDLAEAQYKAAAAKHKVAVAQVAQKEAALKAAQARLSYTEIRAGVEDSPKKQLPPDAAPRRVPKEYLVGERFVDEGAMLMANTPIVSLLDIDSLIGVIYVVERDYPHISKDLSATIATDAFPGKTFSGKIVRIAPFLKEASRQARVDIEIANPERALRPGMFIRVKIELATHDDSTVVPLTALTNYMGRQGVFVIVEKKAQFVPVTLGFSDGEFAEVVSPPISGTVAVLGQHLLDEGSPVIEEKTGEPAGVVK